LIAFDGAAILMAAPFSFLEKAMDPFDLTRRGLLGGFALSASTSAQAGLMTARDAASTLPDFDDPAVNVDCMVRMLGSLDAVDCPWWYTGTIYAQRERQAPVKLFRFEGCEINHFVRAPSGAYQMHARTLSFFRDWDTGRLMTEFKNPITGKTNQVNANVLGGNDWMEFSTTGVTLGRMAMTPPGQPYRPNWQVSGDLVWVITDRGIPQAPVQPILEAQSVFASATQLNDRSLRCVDAHFSSTSFSPYPRWLEMPNEPGHTIWHASGRKLKSIDELPAEYLDRARAMFPGQLSAKPTP
jgi:hypothetical protein